MTPRERDVLRQATVLLVHLWSRCGKQPVPRHEGRKALHLEFRTRLGPSARRTLLREFKEGKSAAALAKSWGLTKRAVYGYVREQANRKPQRFLSAKERTQVARRYSGGASARAVAKEWDVSRPTVMRIAREHGVRKRGRR